MMASEQKDWKVTLGAQNAALNPQSWVGNNIALLHHSNSINLFLYWKSLSLFVAHWNSPKIFEKPWSLLKFCFYSLLPHACNAEHQLVSWSLPLKNTDVCKYRMLGSLPTLSRDFSLLLCCYKPLATNAVHTRADEPSLWGLQGVHLVSYSETPMPDISCKDSLCNLERCSSLEMI